MDGGLLRKKGIKKVCVNDLQLHYKPPKTTLIYLSLFFGRAQLGPRVSTLFAASGSSAGHGQPRSPLTVWGLGKGSCDGLGTGLLSPWGLFPPHRWACSYGSSVLRA